MNRHLHILHLFGATGNSKIDEVAKQRYINLMGQLQDQNITDYTIFAGEYDEVNTKKAINKGHKAIVQSAKDKGYKNAIIMEDDCCFTSKFSWRYFLSQIPNDYDLFTALIYSGDVDESHRIKNGMSGTHTLYSIHNRFFDFVLNQPDDVHCDRNAGMYAYLHKYYVCNPMCVYQKGGYSFNLRQSMTYEPYLIGKKMYGVD